MALQETKLSFRFTGGLETEEDEKHVPLGSLLALENAVFVRPGTIGKRNGTTIVSRSRLDAATPLPAAKATARRGGELLAFDDEAGYSYSAAAGAWKDAGGIVCPVLSHAPIAVRGNEQTHGDIAELSGVTLCSWTEPVGAYIAAYDTESGRCLLSPTLFLSGGIHTRAAVVGENLAAFAIDPANNRVYIATLAPTSANDYNVQILVDDLDPAVPSYDVYWDGTRCAIAWATPGGLRYGYAHQSGVLGSPATGLPSVGTETQTVSGPVAVASSEVADVFAVAWFDGGNIREGTTGYELGAFNGNGVVAVAPDARRLTLAITGDAEQSGIITAWDEADGSTRITHILTADSEEEIRASKVAGRLFLDGDRYFLPIAYESTLYKTLFVVRDDGLIVARVLPGVHGGAPSLDCVPTVNVGDRTVAFAASYRTRLEGLNRDVFTERGVQRVSLDFDDSLSHQTTQMGRTAYLAGAGFLWAYDGESFVEQGFHYAPDDIPEPDQDTPDGDGVDVGTHVYIFAYGWKNAQGELEWGPTSAGTTVTVDTSAKKVTFAVPTLRHTAKTNPRSEAFIGVFRSEADDDATLNMVSSLDPTATGANGYLANDPTVDSVEFVDDMGDEDMLTKEPLYTNGGVVSNDPTATGNVLTSAKDRLFANDPSNESLIRHGQERREGYLAEISPVLTVKLDDFGGPFVAAREMDGSIVGFKQRGVYRFNGAGPTAANQGGFSDSQLVHTDVGAIDPRLVVATPIGTVFLSQKGFRLLDRSFQTVHYIGSPVAKYTDPMREPLDFVSAELLPDRNEVRFLSSSGKALHYDYRNFKWSVWKNFSGVAAEIVGDSYYYVTAGGDVLMETPGVYRDVNVHVPLAVESNWARFADWAQSWQRVWWLTLIGKRLSAHQLRFRAAFDYVDDWAVDIMLDPDGWYEEANYGEGVYGEDVYGGSPNTLYQMKVHLDRECQAMKFRIEDVEATGTYGAAYELSEILITGGVQAVEVPVAAERMG